jgi:hypothetical protein
MAQSSTPQVSPEKFPVGHGAAGSHAMSGSWRINKVNEDESGRTTTYKSSADGMSLSTPMGESWTAKFDGKDYSIKGSYNVDSVSLRKVNDHTVEGTFKRDGKVIETDKMTVAPDGKKMTTVSTSTLTNRTATYIDEKQ